jgi:hypothetical protein
MVRAGKDEVSMLRTRVRTNPALSRYWINYYEIIYAFGLIVRKRLVLIGTGGIEILWIELTREKTGRLPLISKRKPVPTTLRRACADGW